MVSLAAIRKLALSYPETEELPHFEKASFRVKKKIFVTLDSVKMLACVKLSEVDQSVFTAFDSTIIYPIPNKWGKQGWTFIDIKKVRTDMFRDMLRLSYCGVAPKHLAEKYKDKP